MGNRDSSLIIKEEEEVKKEVKQEFKQEAQQEIKREVGQEVGQEIGQKIQQEVEQEVKQEVRQDVEQEVEQKVKQVVRQEAQREVKQEFQREFQQEIKQEVEGDTNTPVVPEDVIIPAAVVLQEEVKPVLTHVSVKRPSSINIESRPHDKHRRRAIVRTTTPKTGPRSHGALVSGTLPTMKPVVQPPNLSMPASPPPEVMATLDAQQAVPMVHAMRIVGRFIPRDPALQKAEIAGLRATAERMEEQYRYWIDRIMKRTEDNKIERIQTSWQADYSQLWTRKSDAKEKIDRLEDTIGYRERRIGFAEVSKYVLSLLILCHPLSITASRLSLPMLEIC
jgi:hypothetical protein